MEAWAEQVSQAKEKWGVQKKQRVTESLRALAAEGYMALDYVEALQAFFGRVEKLSVLVGVLNLVHQIKGEKLSEYIVRVDKIMHQIIQKKGINPQDADKVRLNKVIRNSDPIRTSTPGKETVYAQPLYLGDH